MLDEYDKLFVTKNNIIHLSDCEVLFLALLIKNKNTFTSYEDLIHFVHSKQKDRKSQKALIVMAYRLNKKLKDGYFIINKIKRGYCLIYKKEGSL